MEHLEGSTNNNTNSRVRNYELGQTVGKGNFSTMKLARCLLNNCVKVSPFTIAKIIRMCVLCIENWKWNRFEIGS